MATTLEALLELRDETGPGLGVPDAPRDPLPEADLARRTGTKYRWEIPIVVEGAERVGRLGGGAVLDVRLTNVTGKESLKKTLDFK